MQAIPAFTSQHCFTHVEHVLVTLVGYQVRPSVFFCFSARDLPDPLSKGKTVFVWCQHFNWSFCGFFFHYFKVFVFLVFVWATNELI